MTLVDTTVWIDHLRAGDQALAGLLEHGQVSTHPFVIGELACGNLRNRHTVLGLLRELPTTPVATDEEVLFFIERHRLHGLGIGYVDAHLLAAVALANGTRLWTRDRRLHACATEMGVASGRESSG